MSRLGFFTLVCCCCVVNIKGDNSTQCDGCLGEIIFPADERTYYFTPGSTGNLTWKFTCDDISCVKSRSWKFTPSDRSSNETTLASITDNRKAEPRDHIGLSVGIEKPSTLLLKNVNRSYSGTYKFLLRATSKNHRIVKVIITDAPIVNLSCPGRNEVNEGNNFTCVCRGVGEIPPANVTWYKGVVQISETKLENNTLNLYDVNGTDSGTYKCVAQSYPSEDFKDEKSMELAVRLYVKPNNTNITFIPQPVMIGGSVEIKCDSVGVPDPDFIIKRPNGKSDVTGQSYTIKDVKKSDEGSYTCIATNALGNDSATDNLNVTEDDDEGGTNTGLIVGIVIAVFVLILIIGVVVYCCCCKSKQRKATGNGTENATGNGTENATENATGNGTDEFLLEDVEPDP